MTAPDTSTRHAEGLLVLLALPGVGPATATRLARRYGTLAEVRSAQVAELEQLVPAPAREPLRDAASWEAALGSAALGLERARDAGVRLLTVFEPDYPTLLKRTADCPPVLYVRGQLRPGPRHVACVGTRAPSRFGTTVAQRVAGQLALDGWSIVSGLALGVDAVCHQAALDAGGHTVAILGNGLDAVYPREHERLAQAILAAGGALVSEQPFGSPAAAHNLVQRDRLQAGMSAATVVMQTDVAGGTMHTVRFTLLQGRRLVVPLPQGAHAAEAKSQGLLALAQRTGPELVDMLGAEGEYAALLRRDFAARPPALPLAGKEDYEKLRQVLEEALREPAPARDVRPQLSLFR